MNIIFLINIINFLYKNESITYRIDWPLESVTVNFNEIWRMSRLWTREELIKFWKVRVRVGLELALRHLQLADNVLFRGGGMRCTDCPLLKLPPSLHVRNLLFTVSSTVYTADIFTHTRLFCLTDYVTFSHYLYMKKAVRSRTLSKRGNTALPR